MAWKKRVLFWSILTVFAVIVANYLSITLGYEQKITEAKLLGSFGWIIAYFLMFIWYLPFIILSDVVLGFIMKEKRGKK